MGAIWRRAENTKIWEYIEDDGTTVGIVKPVGGSWECIYRNEEIAIRPSIVFAKRLVENVHKYRTTN